MTMTRSMMTTIEAWQWGDDPEYLLDCLASGIRVLCNDMKWPGILGWPGEEGNDTRNTVFLHYSASVFRRVVCNDIKLDRVWVTQSKSMGASRELWSSRVTHSYKQIWHEWMSKYIHIYPSHGYTAFVADEICKKYQTILACWSSLGTYGPRDV